MAQAGSQAKLERCLALLVRYWAFNMTLIYNRGGNWPGFGYSEEEKAKLRSIADGVPRVEYSVWLALVVVFFLVIISAITIGGMNIMASAIGGEKNMAGLPEIVSYLQLVLDLVVSFSIGFPLAMLPSALLVGRFFGVADAELPDRSTTAFYFHKFWFQLTRIALVLSAALLCLWMFVPGDSKFWVISRLILPLLSPAVAALSAAYYFSARLRRINLRRT
jgi:hypothetical protein